MKAAGTLLKAGPLGNRKAPNPKKQPPALLKHASLLISVGQRTGILFSNIALQPSQFEGV
jgi:hypothetical protein